MLDARDTFERLKTEYTETAFMTHDALKNGTFRYLNKSESILNTASVQNNAPVIIIAFTTSLL